MLAHLKDYLPSEIDFVIPDAAKKLFPATLFNDAKNFKECEAILNDKFSCLFPDGEVAERKYDKHEITEIREEYCVKEENDVPQRKQELEETLESIKAMKKAAEEAYKSILLEISDLAAKVKQGTTDYALPATETVRIALNGYYLFYAWVDGKMKLAKAEKIPQWDRNGLWSNEEQNRKAMKDVFGLDFPEVKKPKDAEDTEAEADTDEATDEAETEADYEQETTYEDEDDDDSDNLPFADE